MGGTSRRPGSTRFGSPSTERPPGSRSSSRPAFPCRPARRPRTAARSVRRTCRRRRASCRPRCPGRRSVRCTPSDHHRCRRRARRGARVERILGGDAGSRSFCGDVLVGAGGLRGPYPSEQGQRGRFEEDGAGRVDVDRARLGEEECPAEAPRVGGELDAGDATGEIVARAVVRDQGVVLVQDLVQMPLAGE